MKLRKLFPFITMLLIAIMVGCSKEEDPAVRPTVTLSDPLNNATNVAINSTISVTFSVPMNPSMITNANFTLKKGATDVAGTVSLSSTTASFDPSADLDPNTLYTAVIKAGVKSKDGGALASDFTWSFTTGAIPDTTVPTLTLTSPLNSATGVALNSAVVVTFSEPMDQTTISASTFTLKDGPTAIAGVVTSTSTTATFTPSSDLAPDKVYTGTITTGMKDMAGNAIVGQSFSFTTAPDVVLPTVSSTDPLDNATGVAFDKVVAVTFSEAMDPLTITASSFTLMKGTTAVAGTVAYSGSTATFTPSVALEDGVVYTALITTDAKDVAGNAIANNLSFSFTTVDTTVPLVSSTDPISSAVGVARNKVIAINFNEAMDPSTLSASTFTLMEGVNSVAGTVSYSETTATFTPSAILAAATTYTATITTGAKDLAGNALASNTVWSFTTSGSSSTLAAVNLGSAINYVILAKTAINNSSTSAITGDLGLSPAATSYITGLALTNATGYATSAQVTGNVYAADMASPTPTNLTTAVGDMITAYNDAAGRPSPDFLELATGNLGGRTLTPGLYKWTNNVTMPSDVTISGGPNDVWIFQISGNLNMSSAVRINLIGGALPKNIFWQVAGDATMGTTSHFEGIILSMTGITFQTGASMNGRALAQTAVILDSNAITKPAN